jgi:hypothetical protein
MGKQISVFLLEMENKAIQQRESENISNFVAYLRLNYQKLIVLVEWLFFSCKISVQY